MEEAVAGTSAQIHALISRAGKKVSKSGESLLLSWSTPWEASSLVPFLYRASGAPRLYWASSRDEVGFAGYGVAALLTASGPKRFQKIQDKSSRLFSNVVLIGENRPEGLLPRLFGGFGFEPDPDPLSLWSGFGAACFILPRYLLSRYRDEIWLTVNHQLRPEDDLEEISWLFTDQVDQLKNELRTADVRNRDEIWGDRVRNQIRPEETADFATWEVGVLNALSEIESGNLQKVVLARGLQLKTNRPIDPARVLMTLGKDYQDCYRFLFEPVPTRAFFGATPELLISVSGTKAKTVALAGSARRGDSPKDDQQIANRLTSDPKELEEHSLVVESLVQSLKPFAQSISAPPSPGIRKLQNIQHLETPITIKLNRQEGILPLVEAIHPTAAVGGVPRDLAINLIKNTELITRGWYASPIGWIDHRGDGLFTVAIRSAVSVGTETMLYAGAGVVGGSDPHAEWKETGLKFRPILEALSEETTNGF